MCYNHNWSIGSFKQYFLSPSYVFISKKKKLLYPGLDLTNFQGPKLLVDGIVMHVLTNVTNNYIC